MSAPRRPNPRVAVGRILGSRDRQDAEERMRLILRAAWESGAWAGAQQADKFHADEADDPYGYVNPYDVRDKR